jgi:hypothetical protein
MMRCIHQLTAEIFCHFAPSSTRHSANAVFANTSRH